MNDTISTNMMPRTDMLTTTLRTICVAAALLSVPARANDAEALAKGEIIVRSSKVAGVSLPRTVVKAVIQAPPEKVWALIADCANYKTTMPRIADSQLVRKEGANVTVCKVTADMPFPLSDLTSVSRATMTTDAVKKRYVRDWKFIEGDYERNEGSWVIEAHGDNATLATYTILVVPKLGLPDALIETAQRNSFPDMMKRLRELTATPGAAK